VKEKSSHRLPAVLLTLFAVISFLLFFIPAFVIRPFRYQTRNALSLAIDVTWIAPSLTLVLCLAAIVLSVRLWRGSVVAVKILTVIALLVSVASAVMVRQNYFEWMFHPIKAAGFIPASNAQLPDKEMVMAVKIGPDARAYPIVQMAYHHILNDTVATEPIVVTY
jgi:hypothetical protein